MKRFTHQGEVRSPPETTISPCRTTKHPQHKVDLDGAAGRGSSPVRASHDTRDISGPVLSSSIVTSQSTGNASFASQPKAGPSKTKKRKATKANDGEESELTDSDDDGMDEDEDELDEEPEEAPEEDDVRLAPLSSVSLNHR